MIWCQFVLNVRHLIAAGRVQSDARERNEPSSGMPPVRLIWSAPLGSLGIQNSLIPDAQRTLACCGPSALDVRSGGILAGAPTWLNKNHRSRQREIQELPLRTTPRAVIIPIRMAKRYADLIGGAPDNAATGV